MYYHSLASDRPHYWKEKDDGPFDPHYSMNNFSRKNGRTFTPQEIEKKYDSVDLEKYAGKKFILGDYTFYGFSSGEYKDKYEKESIAWGNAFYFEYNGFRFKALDFEKKKYSSEYGRQINNCYLKNFEGLDIMFDLLRDNPDVELVPYELEELTGPLGFKITSIYGLTPPPYLQKKHPKYNWENAGEKIGKIDLDHFIKMDIKDGIYQPTNTIMNKLLQYEAREMLHPKIKKLKDFGVHTIKFKNNSNWDINRFYDLDGVQLKASKSVLARYSDMRKYSNDEKAKEEIAAAEKASEEAYEKSIHDDTYTLMQHGKVIIENVRSYDIVQYFENKDEKDFEFAIIAAGKKCFEVAPDLDKIFFGKYGIYSYTEMSGEKFADFDDIEHVNKLKDIKLPNRLITLINHGEIDYPCLYKDDKLFKFDKGATYIGAAKNEKGEVCMISEDGDQGI
jgi:hypothetical protein